MTFDPARISDRLVVELSTVCTNLVGNLTTRRARLLEDPDPEARATAKAVSRAVKDLDWAKTHVTDEALEGLIVIDATASDDVARLIEVLTEAVVTEVRPSDVIVVARVAKDIRQFVNLLSIPGGRLAYALGSLPFLHKTLDATRHRRATAARQVLEAIVETYGGEGAELLREAAAPPPPSIRTGERSGEIEIEKWRDTEEVTPPQRRYVNVCLTRPAEGPVVPKATSLGMNREYHLRIDIGALSHDSVVENAEEHPVPDEFLPQAEIGHWLEVTAVSNDFVINTPRHSMFLPKTGSGWVCACPHGGAHTCTEEMRRRHVLIPLQAPQKPGDARLRLGVYYEKNLIQSQLLTAGIAAAEGPGTGHRSRIDYTLTARLSDLSFLQPRTLNVLTTSQGDGTHRVVVNGAHLLTFNLTEGQMRNAIGSVRKALCDIHFEETGGAFGAKKKRTNLYDEQNGKTKEKFIADLERLAPMGWQLWTLLLAGQPEQRKMLRQWLFNGTSARIQVSRAGGSAFVFPWALLYDIALDGGKLTPCRLLNQWESRDAQLSSCPYEHDHTLNTLCPFGFWGFKHIIEQPPSMPKDQNLPTEIQIGQAPLELVIGLSAELDERLTSAHLQKMKTYLRGFTVLDKDSREALAEALSSDLEFVYFYCHGDREPLPGSSEPIPYLIIGKEDKIKPADITAWAVAKWPDNHWRKVPPLVFINGCHTAELTPELLVNFVDTFAGVYAAGVIGTETSIDQCVASEAAEEFFKQLWNDKSPGVGDALLRMRLHLLRKGNLLGLAYTPYCSASLKYVISAN